METFTLTESQIDQIVEQISDSIDEKAKWDEETGGIEAEVDGIVLAVDYRLTPCWDYEPDTYDCPGYKELRAVVLDSIDLDYCCDEERELECDNFGEVAQQLFKMY